MLQNPCLWFLLEWLTLRAEVSLSHGLSVYEVIRVACLSCSWIVHSQGVKRETSANRVGITIIIPRRNWKQWLHVCIIDLFTDMAAILNLLDLRSIIGCPGGTCSVFTSAFQPKRELQSIFLEKKAIVIIYIQRRHNDLFFSLQFFSRKTWRKIGPKSVHKYWCKYMRSCSCPLGIP